MKANPEDSESTSASIITLLYRREHLTMRCSPPSVFTPRGSSDMANVDTLKVSFISEQVSDLKLAGRPSEMTTLLGR